MLQSNELEKKLTTESFFGASDVFGAIAAKTVSNCESQFFAHLLIFSACFMQLKTLKLLEY